MFETYDYRIHNPGIAANRDLLAGPEPAAAEAIGIVHLAAGMDELSDPGSLLPILRDYEAQGMKNLFFGRVSSAPGGLGEIG